MPRFPLAADGAKPDSAEKAQRLIKELDAAHADEVERCLHALVKCGQNSWDEYSDECRCLIKVRLTAASSFVSTVGLATGSPILFPPNATKFVEWLLTDWWREQGVIEIAYNLIGEE